MKSLIKAAVLSLAIFAPIALFAQSNQPMTRAEVRAELQQVEAAGYRPAAGRDPYYPADAQIAEARVAAQNETALASVAGTSYGQSTGGSSQSGPATPAGRSPSQSMYFTGR